MQKLMVLNCDNTVEVIDAKQQSEVFQQIMDIVGSYTEVVTPIKFTEAFPEERYVIMVDEDGLIQPKYELNALASYLYGTLEHGHVIANTVVVAKLELGYDGYSVFALSDEDVTAIQKFFETIINK